MNINALTNVKLRKVEKINDSSKPVFSSFAEGEDAIKQYHKDVLDSNIEAWIDLIHDITFKTLFTPITIDDAKTLHDIYEHLHINKQTDLSSVLQDKLSALESKLQIEIDRMKNANGFVFVKTSSRSAKDSPATVDKLKQLYKHYLDLEPEKADNNKILCLLRAQTEAMKVREAKEAIQSMISSERIYQDMKIALMYQERFNENFVIRDWVDIEPDMEFRYRSYMTFGFDISGFCCKGKLNALSQYHHLVYSKNLVTNKDAIEKRIRNFFEESVKSRLKPGNDSFIIDFAVTEDRIWVIELNPFLETTDGCLFSWQKESDVLKNGPWEFRIRTVPAHGGKSLISHFWRDIMESVQ